MASSSNERTPLLEKTPIDLSVLGPLRGIASFLIGKYLFEEDTFEELFRKFATLPLAFTSGAVLTSTAYLFWQYLEEGYIADLVSIIGYLVMSVGFLIPYISMRRSGGESLSDRMVGFAVVVLAEVLTVMTISNANYFNTLVCTYSAPMMCFIMNAPGQLKVIFPYFFLLMVIATWNASWRGIADQAPIMLELDAKNDSGWPRFLMSMASLTATLGTTLACFFNSRETRRQIQMAKSSTNITERIMEELQRYNTDKAKELIREAEEEVHCNRSLLKNLNQMIVNLEQYRPFLPNYLLMELSTSRSNSVSRSGGGVCDVTPLFSNTNNNNNNFAAGGDGLSEVEDLEYNSCDSSPMVTPTKRNQRRENNSSRLSRLSRLSSITAGTTGTDGVDFIPMTGVNVNSTPYAGGLSSWKGNVTMAIVETKISQWFGTVAAHTSPTSPQPPSFAAADRTQDRLSLFADTLNTIAATSKASIHSTVGDQIFLSWNGTNKVAQPEIKAAQFLLQFRESVQSIFEVTQAKPGQGAGGPLDISSSTYRRAPPPTLIVGAAASGPTTAYSVLSSSTRQLNLFYDATWLPALNHLYTMALSNSCLMVDSNVQHATSYMVSAQAVDCIRYRARAGKDSNGALFVTAAPGARAGAPQLPPDAFTGPSMRPGVVSESLIDHLMGQAPSSSALMNTSNNTVSHISGDDAMMIAQPMMQQHRSSQPFASRAGSMTMKQQPSRTNSNNSLSMGAAVPRAQKSCSSISIPQPTQDEQQQDRRMTMAFELVSYLDNHSGGGGGDSSRKHGVGEEWMYQLQRLEKEASDRIRREDRVTSVLESLSLRKYDEVIKEVAKIRSLSSRGGGTNPEDIGGGGEEAQGNYSGTTAPQSNDTSSSPSDRDESGGGDCSSSSSPSSLAPLSVAATRLINACECLYYAHAAEQE